MSFTLIPAGSVIKRVYWSVPGSGGYGDDFDERDDAVRRAQEKYRALVESLTESMGRYSTPERIAETANVQTCVDLRWVIEHPKDSGPMSGTDMVVERFGNVMELRTREQIGAASWDDPLPAGAQAVIDGARRDR